MSRVTVVELSSCDTPTAKLSGLWRFWFGHVYAMYEIQDGLRQGTVYKGIVWSGGRSTEYTIMIGFGGRRRTRGVWEWQHLDLNINGRKNASW